LKFYEAMQQAWLLGDNYKFQDLCNAHGDVNNQNYPLDVNSSIRSKLFTIFKPHRIILGKHGE